MEWETIAEMRSFTVVEVWIVKLRLLPASCRLRRLRRPLFRREEDQPSWQPDQPLTNDKREDCQPATVRRGCVTSATSDLRFCAATCNIHSNPFSTTAMASIARQSMLRHAWASAPSRQLTSRATTTLASSAWRQPASSIILRNAMPMAGFHASGRKAILPPLPRTCTI